MLSCCRFTVAIVFLTVSAIPIGRIRVVPVFLMLNLDLRQADRMCLSLYDSAKETFSIARC